MPAPQQNANALVTDITIAEVIPGRVGTSGRKGPAHVKDTKGRVWNVWEDRLELSGVAIGQTYAAMYTSGTYTNPHTGMSRPDNTIIGLNPLAAPSHAPGAAPGSLAVVSSDDRSEDITINGLCHSGPLVELAAAGDVSTIVKVLRTMRLAWREYKKQAAIAPSGGAEFDDEIPY